jgi:potassium-transporting ATPase KdpC subunit
MNMLRQLIPALRMVALLTLLTGLVYPAIVTGLCQLLFHDKANGSLVERRGQIIGSVLIGQNFSRPEYFHPRPSAAGSRGYDPTASGGSNLGATNRKLLGRVRDAADRFREENPEYTGPIPTDALTASGSGLDPHITIANAEAQAARVAQVRHLDKPAVDNLIASIAEPRALGLEGEPRVNVLRLNLALDALRGR